MMFVCQRTDCSTFLMQYHKLNSALPFSDMGAEYETRLTHSVLDAKLGSLSLTNPLVNPAPHNIFHQLSLCNSSSDSSVYQW